MATSAEEGSPGDLAPKQESSEETPTGDSDPVAVKKVADDHISADPEDCDLDPEDAYVTCGSLEGVLKYKRFTCPGINRLCVLFNGELISPKQFSILGGKGSLKDWKSAIRLSGTHFRSLMADGRLDFYDHCAYCTGRCAHARQNRMLEMRSENDILGIAPMQPDIQHCPASMEQSISQEQSTTQVQPLQEATLGTIFPQTQQLPSTTQDIQQPEAPPMIIPEVSKLEAPKVEPPSTEYSNVQRKYEPQSTGYANIPAQQFEAPPIGYTHMQTQKLEVPSAVYPNMQPYDSSQFAAVHDIQQRYALPPERRTDWPPSMYVNFAGKAVQQMVPVQFLPQGEANEESGGSQDSDGVPDVDIMMQDSKAFWLSILSMDLIEPVFSQIRCILSTLKSQMLTGKFSQDVAKRLSCVIKDLGLVPTIKQQISLQKVKIRGQEVDLQKQIDALKAKVKQTEAKRMILNQRVRIFDKLMKPKVKRLKVKTHFLPHQIDSENRKETVPIYYSIPCGDVDNSVVASTSTEKIEIKDEDSQDLVINESPDESLQTSNANEQVSENSTATGHISENSIATGRVSETSAAREHVPDTCSTIPVNFSQNDTDPVRPIPFNSDAASFENITGDGLQNTPINSEVPAKELNLETQTDTKTSEINGAVDLNMNDSDVTNLNKIIPSPQNLIFNSVGLTKISSPLNRQPQSLNPVNQGINPSLTVISATANSSSPVAPTVLVTSQNESKVGGPKVGGPDGYMFVPVNQPPYTGAAPSPDSMMGHFRLNASPQKKRSKRKGKPVHIDQTSNC